MWLGFTAEDVLPSPKSHNRPVIGAEPAVDESLNCTVNGASPLVGVPENCAVGGTFGGPTWMNATFVWVPGPAGVVAVRVTVYVPAPGKLWVGVCAVDV